MGYNSCTQSRTPRSSNRVHMLAVRRCSWRCTSLLSSEASCADQRKYQIICLHYLWLHGANLIVVKAEMTLLF